MKPITTSILTSPLLFLLLLLSLPLLISHSPQFVRFAEAAKRIVHITDDLDDVIDDEEDDAWREWGKKSTPSSQFDLPPEDLSKMDMSQIQAEMAKRQSGPAIGFVKLKFGVRRTPEMVGDIAKKWTEIMRTGAIGARFMGVDLNTVMFNMERGKDVEELKEFILNEPEAYEMKIGDQVFRRPGDPPLDEVIEKLRSEENIADNVGPQETNSNRQMKEEL